MKNRLPVLAILAGLGSFFSSAQVNSFQTPLDLHIDKLRTHVIEPSTVRFAKACGVDLKNSPALYGFANDEVWTWHVVSDIPHSYNKRESHRIGTAEVWNLNNRKVIEEWKAILDLASISRTLYCYDADRKLRMLDAADFEIPVDGTLRWGMQMGWSRKADGGFVASEPFHFIGMDGEPAPAPKLTKDDMQIASHWSKRQPAPMTTEGLKLPESLMDESGLSPRPN